MGKKVEMSGGKWESIETIYLPMPTFPDGPEPWKAGFGSSCPGNIISLQPFFRQEFIPLFRMDHLWPRLHNVGCWSHSPFYA